MYNHDGIKHHVIAPAFKCLAVVGSKDMDTWKMKCQFLYLWNVFFGEILLLMFLVTQFLFLCIIWQYCQISSLWNTMNMMFVRGLDVAYEQYNVKHYSKHEIILLYTCLLYLYFPPDWVGK